MSNIIDAPCDIKPGDLFQPLKKPTPRKIFHYMFRKPLNAFHEPVVIISLFRI